MKTHYFSTIDSLRAIAVLMVLFHHYMPGDVTRLFDLGNLGVDIFFVISGFLITGIILSYKDETSIKNGLKIFYIRRTLRIFPLYYLYLLIVSVWYWHHMDKTELLYAIFYCRNFYIIAYGFGHFTLNHFWSLSVEEQFYLFWPSLILFIPHRYLQNFILSTIVFSILFSLSNTLFFQVKYVEYMHIISCMQALALGALLALLYKRQDKILYNIRTHSGLFLVIFFAGWVFSLTYQRQLPWTFTFLRTFDSLMAFIILIKLILPPKKTTVQGNLFSKIMNLPPVKFIGRISYGIYVYHILVKVVLDKILFSGRLLVSAQPVFMFVAYTAITVGVAYLSFTFIESPINKLKDCYTVKVKS